MSETTELPTIREIEGLWYELQREMVASGQVVGFTANVNDVDGTSSECDVVRVGLFNVVCDGKYLEYPATKGEYSSCQDNLLEDIQKQLKVLLKQTLESKLDLVLIQPVLLAEAY